MYDSTGSKLSRTTVVADEGTVPSSPAFLYPISYCGLTRASTAVLVLVPVLGATASTSTTSSRPRPRAVSVPLPRPTSSGPTVLDLTI